MLEGSLKSALITWADLSLKYLQTKGLEVTEDSVLFPREDGNPHQMNNVYGLKAWKVLLITCNLLLILFI